VVPGERSGPPPLAPQKPLKVWQAALAGFRQAREAVAAIERATAGGSVDEEEVVEAVMADCRRLLLGRR
jgi:hypothetical protein